MRRFIVLLTVIVLLLIVADRAAWWTAQRGLATAIQNSQNLTERPTVHVAGFPFLTQALGGRYQQVDADISDLSVQNGLTVNKLHVRLRGVRVKAGDLIKGQVSKAPVDEASAVATVSYASLDAVAKTNIPDDRLKVKFGPGQGQLLSITGSYASALIKVQVKAQAQVSVKDGDLAVGLMPASLASLPASIRAQVTSLFDGGAYRLPKLPLGFEAKTVTVGPDGVTVSAAATSVELTQQQPAQ